MLFKRLRASFIFFIAGILIWGIIKCVGIAWFAFQPFDSGSNRSSIIDVPRGRPARQISKELLEKGIISDSGQFLRLGRLLGWWTEMKAGEYQVKASQTPVEIFSILTSGVSVSLPLVVREGENIYQIADKIEKRSPGQGKIFLQLTKDKKTMIRLGLKSPLPPTLEGYLFPDTYFFPRKTTAKEVIHKMFQKMNSYWTAKRIQRAQEINLNHHQVLTLASMIEKETGASEERPIISSVFHNRLKKRQRLESDPTTIYGIWETFNGNLRRKHLKQKTKYNTYSFRGLPVGPISNPGLESIDAALNPIKSKYLYFVSKNDGTHVFTTNFKDHKKAVRNFQLNRSARKGKSWRDLKKRRKKP